MQFYVQNMMARLIQELGLLKKNMFEYKDLQLSFWLPAS